MTESAKARLAGSFFLLYIVTGIGTMVLSAQVGGGGDAAAKLAAIGSHQPLIRVILLFNMLSLFYAPVLGVMLYGLTRRVNHELAMLAMVCRVGEGVLAAIPALATLALLSLSRSVAAASVEPSTAHALADLLGRLQGWNTLIAATMFAVGSAIFSWLFLRGRLIPAALAWIGIVSSLLLVIVLPLQLVELAHGVLVSIAWLSMLIFEVPLALWLLVKGVKPSPILEA